MQTHGNEHRKKPINFKALLVSSVLWFFSVLHIDVTRALLAFGFLFLSKVKVSPSYLEFVPGCLPSKAEPNHLLDENERWLRQSHSDSGVRRLSVTLPKFCLRVLVGTAGSVLSPFRASLRCSRKERQCGIYVG